VGVGDPAQADQTDFEFFCHGWGSWFSSKP
jgi:hypothetical protein